MRLFWLLPLFALLLSCARPASNTVVVATASSFRPALETLAALLEPTCDVILRISSGSTGALVAQITQGAPFDLLISADPVLSQSLLGLHEEVELGAVFAIAPMALWRSNTANPNAPIAIANPDIAPFGRAAMQVLRTKHGEELPKLVRGANAAQAFSFVHLNVAKAGYVPLSLLLAADIADGEYEVVEPSLYTAIDLQAVILTMNPAHICIAEQLANADLSRFGYGAP